jgi:hypothetical protein
MVTVGGIDGCPAGWLRLRRDDSATGLLAEVFTTAEELFRDADSFAVHNPAQGACIDFGMGRIAS